MVEEPTKLIIPGASWEAIKRIILAYHSVDGQENPGLGEVASIAGKNRPLVSSCNEFLRSLGILRSDQNKLTEIGNQFAIGLSIGTESVIHEALQQIVRDSPALARLIAILRARGSMKEDAFRGNIIVAAGLNRESRNFPFVKVIPDLLCASGLISIDDGMVSLRRSQEILRAPEQTAPREDSRTEKEVQSGLEIARDEIPIAPRGYIPTPFPLGPNRLAYLSLPGDWSPKELPKLLKMIELAFGSDDK